MSVTGAKILFFIFIFAIIFLIAGSIFFNKFINSSQQANSLIEDSGVILNWGNKTFVLASLPNCSSVNDFYTDQGRPIKKYVLSSNNVNLDKYIAKGVIVSGKVRRETRILKPPEIVCKTTPCEIMINEDMMVVERIELNNTQLVTCQKDYLEEQRARPQK